MEWMVNATHRALYPQKRDPVPIVRGGWVGPMASLDGSRKISPLPGFDPRNIEPVASSYTDWAIAVHPTASTRNRFPKSGYKQMSAQPKTMGCTDNQLEYEIKLGCQIMMFPGCLQKRFTEGGAIRRCISTRHLCHSSHPASCTMGTGSFPGVKRSGRGADHPPLLAPRLRKSRAIPLPTL
jgi:hypothetical protein